MRYNGITVVEVLTVVLSIVLLCAIFAIALKGCGMETRAGKNLKVISKEYDASGFESNNITHYKDLNTGTCWSSVEGNEYYITEEACAE